MDVTMDRRVVFALLIVLAAILILWILISDAQHTHCISSCQQQAYAQCTYSIEICAMKVTQFCSDFCLHGPVGSSPVP